MKLISRLFFLVIWLFISCKSNRSTEQAAIINTDATAKDTSLLKGVPHEFALSPDPVKDSVWRQPVSYYIADPSCSKIAIDFYKGTFRPGSNPETQQLMDLAASSNDKVRPFYRWCLDMMLQIGDTAIADYAGIASWNYAETFPKEFLEYMNEDKTGERYGIWTDVIRTNPTFRKNALDNPGQIRSLLTEKIKTNCKGCSPPEVKQIEKFVEDCLRQR